MASVKRLQIMIEEDLDAALALEAEREGVSEAARIRRYVGERLRRPQAVYFADLERAPETTAELGRATEAAVGAS
jgi:broad specificity phosphatase PhoE